MASDDAAINTAVMALNALTMWETAAAVERQRSQLAAATSALRELHEASADIVQNRIEYGPAAKPRVDRLIRAVHDASKQLAQLASKEATDG